MKCPFLSEKIPFIGILPKANLFARYSIFIFYMKGQKVFLNNRYMDNLFLNRMNSRQGIVKKKQETIFEISIGFLYHFKILLKTRFRYAAVFSNDP
jgi:hypothetical protein